MLYIYLGVIQVDESRTAETTLEIVEGMQIDRGFVSPYFVTNQSTMTTTLDKPYILIYDTMQFIKPDVHTIVIGQAASMGSFLAQAGAPGKRFVLPESRTMIHRVSSGTPSTCGSIHVEFLFQHF